MNKEASNLGHVRLGSACRDENISRLGDPCKRDMRDNGDFIEGYPRFDKSAWCKPILRTVGPNAGVCICRRIDLSKEFNAAVNIWLASSSNGDDAGRVTHSLLSVSTIAT